MISSINIQIITYLCNIIQEVIYFYIKIYDVEQYANTKNQIIYYHQSNTVRQ